MDLAEPQDSASDFAASQYEIITLWREMGSREKLTVVGLPACPTEVSVNVAVNLEFILAYWRAM